jgi:enolase-phosphatase E1
MAEPIEAIVTDIEGTVAPVTFVTATLFPYARAALPDFVRTHRDRPEVAAEIAAVRALAGDPDLPEDAVILQLQRWIDEDRKVTPLKSLQGMIWAEGYAAGALCGVLYDEVAPALHRWRAAGLRLFAYSSGSVEAQRLIFRHSRSGDLTPLFEGYFDTRLGGKLLSDSYRRLAEATALEPDRILFLSDHEGELDAARAVGIQTACLDRDGVGRSGRHPTYPDLGAIEQQYPAFVG